MFFAWINPEFEKMMWVFVCWLFHVRVNKAELQGASLICCLVLDLVFGSEFDQKLGFCPESLFPTRFYLAAEVSGTSPRCHAMGEKGEERER